MKLLSIVGTIAMFLVGGGILLHGVPAIAHAIPSESGFATSITKSAISMAIGLCVGGILLGMSIVFQKIVGKRSSK
jgi:predicted DNA repair protein MutK